MRNKIIETITWILIILPFILLLIGGIFFYMILSDNKTLTDDNNLLRGHLFEVQTKLDACQKGIKEIGR